MVQKQSYRGKKKTNGAAQGGLIQEECPCTYSLFDVEGCEGEPSKVIVGIDSYPAGSLTFVPKSIKTSLPSCKYEYCKWEHNPNSCHNHTGGCMTHDPASTSTFGGSVTTFECGLVPSPAPTPAPTFVPPLVDKHYLKSVKSGECLQYKSGDVFLKPCQEEPCGSGQKCQFWKFNGVKVKTSRSHAGVPDNKDRCLQSRSGNMVWKCTESNYKRWEYNWTTGMLHSLDDPGDCLENSDDNVVRAETCDTSSDRQKWEWVAAE